MSRLLMTIVAAPFLLSAPALAQDTAPLDTLEQRFSYIIGLQLAERMKQQGLHESLDVNAFGQAMRDVFTDTAPRLTAEQMQSTLAEMRAAEAAEQSAKGAEAKAAQEAFLAENAAKENVETTDSGLQYKIIEEGTGEQPEPTDTVKVHYEGQLLDGTVFDSSYARGEPATFQVNQVIPGWQEALQLMHTGAEYQVWIPSDLAYGEQGAGADIGPNETLNFTIELLEIVEQ